MIHLLNVVQRVTCCKIPQILLDRCHQEGYGFLDLILTSDESWVHHYTLESKRSRKKWHFPNENCPVKDKTPLSVEKVCMTVFFYTKGIIFINFLRGGRNINAVYVRTGQKV